MDNRKRSGEHERSVQELRRSNAAGAHGNDKYNRKQKYPTDYRQLIEDEYEDCEYQDLV